MPFHGKIKSEPNKISVIFYYDDIYSEGMVGCIQSVFFRLNKINTSASCGE